MLTLEAAEPTHNLSRPMDLEQHRLASTDALDGERIDLEFDGGGGLGLVFTADTVAWTLILGDEIDARENSYDAVQIRPGVFFVDFVAPGSRRQLSIVIDRGAGRAIALVDDLLDGEPAGEPVLRQAVLVGRIGAAENGYVPIGRTRELLGRRLYCEYSDEAAIEHIYLNTETIAWQWLAVPIPALAHEVGVETAMMWKVAEELYLVHMRSGSPLTLILLLDLEGGRNVGRLFGQGGSGSVYDERCGAKLTVLGRFDYPDHHQPA